MEVLERAPGRGIEGQWAVEARVWKIPLQLDTYKHILRACERPGGLALGLLTRFQGISLPT